MDNESAIIVPVAEAEPLVGNWRRQYDETAKFGVPAHITLLYPFRPPEQAVDEIPALHEFFRKVAPFRYALTEVRRFTATVYLRPDQSERFVQVITQIAGRWPDCQPYRGAFADIVPHLTVADKVDAATMNAVESALRPGVPIACRASEAQLLFSSAEGSWLRQATFLFGG
jgi:2'-5' RNA ligase